MQFEISPKALVDTLKRLVPHKKQLVKKGPLVTLDAAEGCLSLTGQFDNTWSIPASVKSHGSCTVDIAAFLTSLKTYNPKVVLTFALEVDGLKFGTTKLKLHAI